MRTKLNALGTASDEVGQLIIEREQRLIELENSRYSLLDQIAQITDVQNRSLASQLESQLALLNQTAILAEYEDRIAKAKQEQTAQMLEQVGLALQTAGNQQFAVPINNPLEDREAALREQQRIFEVGPEAADFIGRVEELVNQGVSFSDAFDLEKAIYDMEKLNEQVEEIREVAGEVASAFTDGVDNVLRSLIDDTRSVQQAFADMFANLSDVFMAQVKEALNKVIADGLTNLIKDISGLAIDTGTNAALATAVSSNAAAATANTAAVTAATAASTALTTTLTASTASMVAALATNTAAVQANTLAKAIPGRALGGPVKAGSPYVVGEVGPELIIPRENGFVVPNNRLQAAVEQMAEPRMSGGEVMANRPYKVGEAGPELMVEETGQSPYDVARSAMVVSGRTVQTKGEEKKQDEINATIDEYISGTDNSPVTINTRIINQVEYATVDQVKQASDFTYRRTKAGVLKDFRNRPASRGKAGI